jgi:K+-sensing histidine kinase KdpD
VIQEQVIQLKNKNVDKDDSLSFKIMDNKKKINIQSTIFKGISSSFALITVSDITKVKLFEKAKQGDRYKNMYFQSMAHDLRTPLVTVISANENILLTYPDDTILVNIMKLSNSSCLYLISIIE